MGMILVGASLIWGIIFCRILYGFSSSMRINIRRRAVRQCSGGSFIGKNVLSVWYKPVMQKKSMMRVWSSTCMTSSMEQTPVEWKRTYTHNSKAFSKRLLIASKVDQSHSCHVYTLKKLSKTPQSDRFLKGEIGLDMEFKEKALWNDRFFSKIK